MRFFITIFSLVYISAIFAQQPPSSNLLLFDFEQLSDTQWVVHSPKFLTQDNAEGYNNQPSFMSRNQIMYTEQKAGALNTNIVKLDLENDSRQYISRTGLSEYSATKIPNKTQISVIRVEKDGWQTLWAYSLDNEKMHQNLFPEFQDNLGYHSWLSDSTVALFVLGDEPTLRIGNIRSGKITTYTSNIGRCLKTTAEGHLLYIHKYTDDHTYLKRFDPLRLKMEIVAEIEIDGQDFELVENRYIVMGNEDKLVLFDLIQNKWLPAIDLSPFLIDKITRLSYHSGKLVIVNNAS